MKGIIKWSHETCATPLTYVALDDASMRLLLFTDASFASAPEFRSQMGYVLVLADKNNCANILTWGSSVCKRVTRSVMAAELFALIYGFDHSFTVRDALHQTTGQLIPIYAFGDSRTVFNVIAKQSSTTEKRLQIDVNALRESYRKGELSSLAWIPGASNPADGLTKGPIKASHPLWKLMRTNHIDLEVQGWVQTQKKPNSSTETSLFAPLCEDYDVIEKET